MPKMDAGPTDGPAGPELATVWVTLTEAEAAELLQALQLWAADMDAGGGVTGWHAHVTDDQGRELTIAIAE